MRRINCLRIFRPTLLAAFAALASPLAAAAQDVDIRFIDRNSASSDCVGEAGTPVCAVETALACRIRGDATLCERVRLGEAAQERPGGAPNPDPLSVLDADAVEYVADKADVSEDGAAATVGVSVRLHGDGWLAWPERGGRRLEYRLSRDGETWRIAAVAWQPLVRFIDPRGGGKCVGNTATPVCTVETHIACRLRDDAALCGKAGVVEGTHFRPKGATVLYVVSRIRRWEPPEQAAPGSAFVIVEVWESTQWQPGTRPGEGGAAPAGEAIIVNPAFVPTRYTLEGRLGAWRVVGRAERP